MLPPTSERLREPDVVPYFLWGTGMNVAELREVLAGSDMRARDEALARLLREANTRDVWIFVDWGMVDEAWPRIVHRLGRSRRVWEMIRARREERMSSVRAE